MHQSKAQIFLIAIPVSLRLSRVTDGGASCHVDENKLVFFFFFLSAYAGVRLCPAETSFMWATPRNAAEHAPDLDGAAEVVYTGEVWGSPGASACGDSTYDSNYACKNCVFMQMGAEKKKLASVPAGDAWLSAHRFFLFFFVTFPRLRLLHLRLIQILESFKSVYTHTQKLTKMWATQHTHWQCKKEILIVFILLLKTCFRCRQIVSVNWQCVILYTLDKHKSLICRLKMYSYVPKTHLFQCRSFWRDILSL